MSQTAYTVEAALAFPGMLGEGGKVFSVSRANEDAALVEAGMAAVAGTDPETQFARPSAAAEVFLGIVTAKHGRQDLDTAGATSFEQNENVELMQQGRIWVTTEVAVAAGDGAFFVHTGGGEGGWRNDVDGGNADAVPGAVFLRGNAAPGLALVSINIP